MRRRQGIRLASCVPILNVVGWAVLVPAAVAAISSEAASATAATKVITVHLQDATDDPSMVGMKLAADSDSVAAGPVSFVVMKDSKSVVHELLVFSCRE